MWKNLSIAKRLYFAIGAMAILIAAELATLNFSMNILSAVRAFVGGEGLWSKAQKNAAFRIQRFGATRDSADYQAFLDHLKIPEGDRRARLELIKPHPNEKTVREGFLAGGIHAEDIEPMSRLLRRFSREKHLARAIEIWTYGDQLIEEFKNEGVKYYQLLVTNDLHPQRIQAVLKRILVLNNELTQIEEEFSKVLGEGSRWLEHFIMFCLFLAVLTVETIGLTLTFFTIRSTTGGLSSLNEAALRIGSGDFSRALKPHSFDEIGQLTISLEQMRQLLDSSYKNLEKRVEERTAELAAMAEENERLYNDARKAISMRDEFMSIASHELRTPLTAMQIQLEIFLRRLDRATNPNDLDLAKLRAAIDAALKNSRRLLELEDELLDLTRIRAGRFELSLSEVDLNYLVVETINQFQAESRKYGVPIFHRNRGSILGFCDPLRMRQVIGNLLSNAIKYGQGKPVEVSTSQDSGRFILKVIDRGVGISKVEEDRIFDRFERGSVDGRIGGLGLGLYICRQIIEKHGGRITVSSRPGEGSVFTVELPLSLSLLEASANLEQSSSFIH